MNDSVHRLEAKLRGEEWTKDGCDDGNCYYVTGSGNKPPKALWRTPLDHTSPAGMLWFMEALKMDVRRVKVGREISWYAIPRCLEYAWKLHTEMQPAIIAAIEAAAKENDD